ncbi:MAG TPA: DUF3137 domain-containing protein [Spirochaetota bacterium]|nr:DUF3137 domain-containing protein [Spirochaetota bacterium]HOL57256.1 DUF3137 domain-containing protein [Spirochaetota bacterium]HPP04864.1 DUF3137 domain-containing protein [Spirochaetota bacterium]
MKTIEELKEFYNSDLMGDLKVLEEARTKIAKKLILINILCGIGLILPIILFFIIPLLGIILGIGIIVLWIFLAIKASKGYKSDFKSKIIHRIIKFIDKNLEYFPEDKITEVQYMASRLFPRTPDRYNGDDYVRGKIGETEIEFSEIHSEYKTESKNGTQWHTIFKGLFFIANFNKKFKSETMVLPDVAQKMFGNLIGNFLQGMNKFRGELIKMDDPEFEKLFVVYGKDQIEARYILTPSLMKRITEFQKKSKKSIYLSFINNKIYVAISYYKNLFEPKIFSTLINFDLIKEYYEDMSLAIGIVEELNLNTRIWG